MYTLKIVGSRTAKYWNLRLCFISSEHTDMDIVDAVITTTQMMPCAVEREELGFGGIDIFR